MVLQQARGETLLLDQKDSNSKVADSFGENNISFQKA